MYFELQDKKDQLTETEKLTLSSILDYLQELRVGLEESKRISLDTSQIVFALPPGWIESRQTDMLRTLFLKTGWIAPKDGNNKLILVPFIETLINCIQKITDYRIQFGREKKYILYSIYQMNETTQITYTCTCFQMQSAKELIVVSKKLASSEFLLAPTILENRSIKLLDLNHVLRVAIKELLAAMQTRQGGKAQCVSNKEDEEVLEIASVLAEDLDKIHDCVVSHLITSMGTCLTKTYFVMLSRMTIREW